VDTGKRSKDQAERGSALIVALMMLMGLAFAAAALVMITSSDLKTAGQERRGTQAQFAAEAGIQEVMHRLALSPGTNVTANSITFDACIRDAGSPLDPNWETRVYIPGSGTPSLAGVTYTPTVQVASGGLDYSRSSRYLSVRHKWIDRDGDGVRDANEIVRYDAKQFPPENFDSGSAVEIVEVEGYRGDARRRLRVETTRYPFSPNVIAALSSDRGVDVRGAVSICGHDHLATTPVGTDLTTGPCSPTWDQTSGHHPAITTTGDLVDTRGTSDLLGDPAATDTSSTNPFYSLAEALGVTQDIVDEILSRADHTSSNDGSPLDGITYINGNATGGERFSNITGSGLLYVNGDLDVSGNFVWKGLIYVEGNFTITGTPWILGGVLVRGRSDYAFSGGAPAILYSSEMMRIALERAFDYVVLSWKEF
jgi:Tfp pilus assembly protein PilX